VRTMASPQAWLSTVGINLARSWWRRRFALQRAQRRLGPRPEFDDSAGEPADVLAIRTAVATLPHRQRAALVLRYYAGLSIAETARQLHCAEGTVKSLTHRALATLRVTFDVDDELDDPGDVHDPEGPDDAATGDAVADPGGQDAAAVEQAEARRA
jgi:DNA-directed RNA polymerase specialized sigma24 family protein